MVFANSYEIKGRAIGWTAFYLHDKMASQVNTAENRCSKELNREVRCKTGAVPPLSMGSHSETATVASADAMGRPEEH
jgi:hypothetical protein